MWTQGRRRSRRALQFSSFLYQHLLLSHASSNSFIPFRKNTHHALYNTTHRLIFHIQIYFARLVCCKASILTAQLEISRNLRCFPSQITVICFFLHWMLTSKHTHRPPDHLQDRRHVWASRSYCSTALKTSGKVL